MSAGVASRQKIIPSKNIFAARLFPKKFELPLPVMANVRFGYVRKIGALLLLLLFTEYLGSTSLFVHSHHVGGHLVVHSHPYSGSSDNPHHSHSAQQCKAISLLSVFTALAAAALLTLTASAAASVILTVRRTSAIYSRPTIHSSLRAPPATI